MAVFPSLTPSSRVFTLGDYSHALLRTMGGAHTQVRHSNVIVGAGIELQYIGLSEADMLSVRTHYITSRGTFNVFTLPSALWIGTTDPTPPSYTWRYTEIPRVSEDGNGHYDVAVKLEMMPPDPSGDISSTQDVVIGAPSAIIQVRGLAPTFVNTEDFILDVPAAVIQVQGIAPTFEEVLPPTPIPATYAQISVNSGNTAATAAGMTNGVFAETTQTATAFASPIAWVRMDFGAPTAFGRIWVGCNFAGTLAGGWNKSVTENAYIAGSNSTGGPWTELVASTGTFTQGIQSYAVPPGSVFRYVRISKPSFIAVTEFYATVS